MRRTYLSLDVGSFLMGIPVLLLGVFALLKQAYSITAFRNYVTALLISEYSKQRFCRMCILLYPSKTCNESHENGFPVLEDSTRSYKTSGPMNSAAEQLFLNKHAWRMIMHMLPSYPLAQFFAEHVFCIFFCTSKYPWIYLTSLYYNILPCRITIRPVASYEAIEVRISVNV